MKVEVIREHLSGRYVTKIVLRVSSGRPTCMTTSINIPAAITSYS